MWSKLGAERKGRGGGSGKCPYKDQKLWDDSVLSNCTLI